MSLSIIISKNEVDPLTNNKGILYKKSINTGKQFKQIEVQYLTLNVEVNEDQKSRSFMNED